MHWRASRAQGTPASQVSVVSLMRSRRVRPLCVSMTTPRMPPSRTSRLLPRPSQKSGVPSGSVAEEGEQVGAVARAEKHVRGPADVPRGVARHRLVALHARFEFGVEHEQPSLMNATSRDGFRSAARTSRLPPGRGGP